MGFGLPAAIGAKVAAPHKTVIDIDGDASFSMTAMELATASQFNIGVKVLILNNEFQGMVVQWQGTSFPLSTLQDLYIDLFSLRSLLRKTILAYGNDEPRFCPIGTSDGCPRPSMSYGRGITRQDEGVLGVR
jgi:glyoxylate carboligase